MTIEIAAQPKQVDFLTTEADIALYGGSAGGGKTFGLLLYPLYYLHNPRFNAVFFRRNTVDVRNPGGLWDESKALYYACQGRADKQALLWTFPNNSTIKFAHLENEDTVYNWQGAQINLLIFDELTHFSENQFWYMLSRNRSTSGVRPRVRMSTNPEKDSWVRKLISWWIDENGFAIPARSGVIRWFIRRNDELIWGDSPEEVGEGAKSFTFIPAKLNDNQALVEKDPDYINNLMAQNIVERARLLDGNWNISWSDFGSVINGKDFLRYEFKFNSKGEPIYPLFEKTWFVVDTASKVKEANDYSVIGLFAKTLIGGQYYILDWFRGRLEVPDVEQKIIDLWNQWKPQVSPQGLWIEDQHVGIAVIQNLKRKGLPVFPLKPVKDKFLRLNDVLGIIKSNLVFIPESAPWIEKFIEECEFFRGDLKHVIMNGEKLPHDDQVDVLAYGLSNQIVMHTVVKAYDFAKAREAKNKHKTPLWMQ